MDYWRGNKVGLVRMVTMQLRTQQMLATSVPITHREIVNVDESEKSINRIWSSETFYDMK